jgi:N-sulfoglucosamine sulfohydrolase
MWLLIASALAAGQSSRPNIVLMITDDQGLQAGCYGDPIVPTPNLDKLASEGVRFTNAFCTTSSCSPSRSVILTGLYNHANGQYGLQHDVHNFSTFPRIRGLPRLLGESGYRTAWIGKVHVQPESAYAVQGAIVNDGQSIPQMLTSARAFLNESRDQPFFLLFCTHQPHRAGKGFGNPQKRQEMVQKYSASQLKVPSWLPDNPAVREDLSEYYEATGRADEALGGLHDALEKTGHLEDTAIIYMSDNGPPFPGAKTTLYEPGVHLPLVMCLPSGPRGTTCDALVTWADITPTILALTGVKPPYPLQGRSLLPIINEKSPAGWDEVYLSHSFHEVTMYYPMRAIRTRQFKLILNLAHELSYPFASDIYGSPTWQSVLKDDIKMLGPRPVEAFLHRPKWELYDLQKDPGEAHNLADDPASADALALLQKKLRSWQEQTKDPWVIKYTHE